jgi:hypothetical protein
MTVGDGLGEGFWVVGGGLEPHPAMSATATKAAHPSL